MQSTTKWGLPYPDLSDPADVPRFVTLLAQALDTVAMDFQGTHANRPAAGKAGRWYFETDTGHLFRDDGTAWREPFDVGKIAGTQLTDDTVTQAKMAPDSIGAPEIIAGAVGSSELASLAVTAAKMGTMDGFVVRRSSGAGNQAVTQNNETVITWDTEDYDPVNMWVSGSPTIVTIGRSGWWLLDCNILTDAAAPQVSARLSLKANGVLIARDPNGDAVDPHVVALRRLNATDQITATLYHNKAATVNITPSGNFPYITGVYLGA